VTDVPRVVAAAVAYGPDDDVDAALATAVQTLRREGWRIGGLLQRFGAPVAPGKREMLLTVLPDGETIRLDEPRGKGVQGCTLCGDALARAAMALRAAADAQPDLLVVHRFGKQEAGGEGMRAELAHALASDAPVIVAVRHALLPAWQAFIGAPTEVLPAAGEPVCAWARRQRYASSSAARWAAASIAR